MWTVCQCVDDRVIRQTDCESETRRVGVCVVESTSTVESSTLRHISLVGLWCELVLCWHWNMVLLHFRNEVETQFIVETTTDASVDEVTALVSEIHNERLRLMRLAQALEDLAKSGPVDVDAQALAGSPGDGEGKGKEEEEEEEEGEKKEEGGLTLEDPLLVAVPALEEEVKVKFGGERMPGVKTTKAPTAFKLRRDLQQIRSIFTVLKETHSRYFAQHGKEGNADAKEILTELKLGVLKGVNIVFSKVVELDRVEQHPMVQLAVSFGAQVSLEMGPDVTHLVAPWGTRTRKVEEAMARPGMYIVSIDWFRDSTKYYLRQNESRYPIGTSIPVLITELNRGPAPSAPLITSSIMDSIAAEFDDLSSSSSDDDDNDNHVVGGGKRKREEEEEEEEGGLKRSKGLGVEDEVEVAELGDDFLDDLF